MVQTYADITGTGATVAIATSGSAKWVQIVAPSANSATARWGDSSTTSSRGGLLPAGSGQFLPPVSRTVNDSVQVTLYQLPSIYVYIANGDKITVVADV